MRTEDNILFLPLTMLTPTPKLVPLWARLALCHQSHILSLHMRTAIILQGVLVMRTVVGQEKKHIVIEKFECL